MLYVKTTIYFLQIHSLFPCCEDSDHSCDSSDSISRAWEILDGIPGRATGAYSHSQV
jgi:hypothetical protein